MAGGDNNQSALHLRKKMQVVSLLFPLNKKEFPKGSLMRLLHTALLKDTRRLSPGNTKSTGAWKLKQLVEYRNLAL